MKKFAKLILVGLMVFALVACGGGGAGGDVDVDTTGENGDATNAVIYTVEDIQVTMAELLDIDESEIEVEERDTGVNLSYGDWDIWFEATLLDDPEFAKEIFQYGVWDEEDYEKLLDQSDHKIWIERVDAEYDSLLALKGNLVITVSSPVEHEVLIEALDLD